MFSADRNVPAHARDCDAGPAQVVVRGSQHDRQLHVRRRAETVDEQRDAFAAIEHEIGDDARQQRVDKRVGRQRHGAFDAFLAVDAEAELDLVIGETEPRFPGAGDRAAATAYSG